MPIIELTEAECQQLIQMLINSNPVIVKILQQVQQQQQAQERSTNGAERKVDSERG